MTAATAVRADQVRMVRAYLVGAAFDGHRQVRGALADIRATGTAADIVGVAIPMPGDPRREDVAGDVISRIEEPRGLVPWLRLVIDPHRPTFPTFQEQVSGRNVPLAYAVLGDLADWIGAAGYMRVHGVDGASTWILGRPNHAASVQGGSGPNNGDVLATIGIPEAQRAAYRALVIGGQCVVTTCETDPGRARRDAQVLRRHGGQATFVEPIMAPGAPS